MSRTVVPLTTSPGSPTLICLGQAGSGAGEFRRWAQLSKDAFSLSAVRLPGRETRRREPFLTSMAQAVDHIATDLASTFEDPARFGLYGQCAGVPVFFELVRELERRGAPRPAFLCVSGFPLRSEQEILAEPGFDDLSHEESLEYLRATDAVPDAVLDRPEFYETFVVPILADSRLVQKWRPAQGGPLSIPLFVVSQDGHDETAARADDWAPLTTASFATIPHPPGDLPSRADDSVLLPLFEKLFARAGDR